MSGKEGWIGFLRVKPLVTSWLCTVRSHWVLCEMEAGQMFFSPSLFAVTGWEGRRCGVTVTGFKPLGSSRRDSPPQIPDPYLHDTYSWLRRTAPLLKFTLRYVDGRKMYGPPLLAPALPRYLYLYISVSAPRGRVT